MAALVRFARPSDVAASRIRHRTFVRVLRDLYRRPTSAFGTTVVLLFVLLAIFGPWIAPYGSNEQIYTNVRQAPSTEHWFGTDLLGRDIFSRVVHGARSILSLTGLGALLAVAAGTFFGLATGYIGGWLDETVMRVFDSVLAIPALLLALVLVGSVGQSRASVLAVIAVVYIPIVARVVRSETLSIKAQGFVEAARLQRESLLRILFREILPSVLPALSVEAALRFSYGIFLVASLGYLGVGVQPPTPDWGLMVREARDSARGMPWALYFPAGAIALLVVSVNLAADGLKRSLQAASQGLSLRARRRIARVRRRSVKEPTDATSHESTTALVSLAGVTASYYTGGRWLDAVRDLTLDVRIGETVGLVGESGSGKTTLALAIVQYMSANGAVRGGAISFDGRDLLALKGRKLRALRGAQIGLIPQDPLASLNPAIRVGEQVAESLRWQLGRGRANAAKGALELLEHVRIADPTRVARHYPHQLSGGMQQRVAIAMGLSAEPRFLILDEPTTGLDVTTEAAILDLLTDLLATGERASLYISHDLGVVSHISDRVVVLYAGELVEIGPKIDLFRAPRHPYTLGLLRSIPRVRVGNDERSRRLPFMPGSIPALDALPSGCIFRPRCSLAADVCAERPGLHAAGDGRLSRCHRWERVEPLKTRVEEQHDALPVSQGRTAPEPPLLRVEGICVGYPVARSLSEVLRRVPRQLVRAVDDLSIDIPRGKTLGVVGESGSGKTTLARALLGLEIPHSGTVSLHERILPASLAKRRRDDLRVLQAVSQNPDQALNPYLSVGTSLERPLIRLAGLGRREARVVVSELLERVGLPVDFADRLPGQLSGGEKQRVAMARAFSARPSIVICDEATSSLDVSVQALVLNLLRRLQEDLGGAYLFITHDLAVVSHLADRIAVMYLGRLMEQGSRDGVLLPPYHPYTEALLCSFPGLGRRDEVEPLRLSGEIPSPVDVPSGCPFHPRCPRYLGAVCRDQAPPWRSVNHEHAIYCHLPLEDLDRLQRPIFADDANGASR